MIGRTTRSRSPESAPPAVGVDRAGLLVPAPAPRRALRSGLEPHPDERGAGPADGRSMARGAAPAPGSSLTRRPARSRPASFERQVPVQLRRRGQGDHERVPVAVQEAGREDHDAHRGARDEQEIAGQRAQAPEAVVGGRRCLMLPSLRRCRRRSAGHGSGAAG